METVTLEFLKVKLFADGADKAGMLEMYANPYIKGFTTNPTLMRKAGISDYLSFAREILGHIPDRPLSLEVFSDDFSEMEQQALRLGAPEPGPARDAAGDQPGLQQRADDAHDGVVHHPVFE